MHTHMHTHTHTHTRATCRHAYAQTDRMIIIPIPLLLLNWLLLVTKLLVSKALPLPNSVKQNRIDHHGCDGTVWITFELVYV